MNSGGEDEYDLPVDQMEAMSDGTDAFANVGQGLVGDHKTAMLQYWQEIIDDIERISEDGTGTDVFKSTVLPLARIKKVMKTDSEVRMISAEAPILFAKGCDIFITELTMRAWIHAEENKRRTLQRSDIATAIQKSDVFDFLIDIVPREEAQPRRTSHRISDHHHYQDPHVQSTQAAAPSNLGGAPMGVPPQMQNSQARLPGSLAPGSMGGGSGAAAGGITAPPGANQEMAGYASGIPGNMPNLNTLSNIANLGNINGMDMSSINIANMPIGYENMPMSANLGTYPTGAEIPFPQQTMPGQGSHIPPQQQQQQQQMQPQHSQLSPQQLLQQHQQLHQQQLHRQQLQQQPQQQQQERQQQHQHQQQQEQSEQEQQQQQQQEEKSEQQQQQQEPDPNQSSQPPLDQEGQPVSEQLQKPLNLSDLQSNSQSKDSQRRTETSTSPMKSELESTQPPQDAEIGDGSKLIQEGTQSPSTEQKSIADESSPLAIPQDGRNGSSKGSSNPAQAAASSLNPSFVPKDEESFSGNVRYDGDLRFTAYPSESVDVSAYGQSF